MNKAVRPAPIRFRGRSFMAIVLAPEPPIFDWLGQLDEQIARAPTFFVGRPVVLDLAAVPLSKSGLGVLIEDLRAREIRVMGIEGVDPAWLGSDAWGLPPMMSGARAAGTIEVPEDGAPAQSDAPRAPSSLLVDRPVRSGETIVFPEGDVTIVGSVSWGAEVVAGGSIHVYGTLRGRAMAGSAGNPKARVFCNRLEAELLAIDGLYRTADDMDAACRGRAAQAWLEDDVMIIAALD